MTLVVEGVPTEISRDRICDLIRELGVDPDVVQTMRFEPKVVEILVASVDDAGRRYLDAAGDLAQHTLTIRIT